MTQLSGLLRELEAEWARLGVPVNTLLRPPLQALTIRSELEPLIGPVHPDLLAWFEWHDGSEPLWVAAPWRGAFATVHFAISQREMNMEISAGEDIEHDPNPYGWGAEWIPLLTGPSMGDLVLNSATGEVLAPYWDDNRWPNRVAPDLSTAVALWLDVLRRDYFRWIDGAWIYDYAAIPAEIRASDLVN